MRRLTLPATVVIGLAFSAVAPPAHAAGPRPLFQLPFPCGESWHLNTYAGHDDYDIDMFANTGTTNGRPIVASLGGTVQSAGFDSGGGWHVKLNHGNGWQTLYLHMIAQPAVSAGQTVVMGQRLGNVGSTGNSGAPHLHYEQLADGTKTESWFDGVPSGIRSDGDPSTGPLFIGGPTSAPVDVVSNNSCAPAASQSSGAVVFKGVLYEFARGADNTLKYWFANGGPWSGAQTIGGPIAGDPVATVHNGVLHVFAIGTDGTIKYWFASGGPWSAMQTFGSNASGALSSVVFNGVPHVFARGTDGGLKYWFASGGGWSAMQTIGGSIGDAVSSVVHNGVLYAFAIGTDGTIKYWFATGGPWSAMQSFGGPVGGGLSSVVFNGVLHVFARGTDGGLKYWFASGGGWSAMQTIGGSIKGGVSGVVFNGVLYAFARGTDGTIKYWFAGGGAWSAMQSLGGGVA